MLAAHKSPKFNQKACSSWSSYLEYEEALAVYTWFL